MGCHEQTKQTLAQTEQQLLNILFTNANKLLVTPRSVPNPVTVEDLQALISAVAHNDFKKKYNYEYNGQGTVTIPAPADKGVPSATEGVCSFHDINDEAIEKYVDDRILSGLELGYIKNDARASLITLSKSLFKSPSDNNWVVQDFTKDYENQDSKDIYSVRSNSMFVWTNAKLLVDGQEAKYVIICYVGVYFNVDSPTKLVRNNLLKILLTNALSLKPVGADTTGTETQRLQAILEPYLRNKFKDQNQYEYKANDTRPKDMAKSSENWVRGTVAFCLPQSNKAQDVVDYVNINVLGAMKLPKYLQNTNGPAYKDLLTHFEKLLGQGTDSSWTSVAFDKSYDSPDAGENSMRTSAIMVWSNSSLTESNKTCQQLYLYYVGVYYQIISPQFVAREKLLTNLITLAKKLDTNLPDPVDDSSPQLALKIILDEYAKREFKRRTGYDYSENNAKPDDLAPNKKAYGISTMMYFPTSPVSSDTIATKIDDSIIGQIIMPEWLENPLKKNLGNRLKSNTDEAKLDSWNSNLYQRQYSGPRDGILPWNVRGVITYANGQVVEDGVTVTASMVHFLGIFYPTSDNINARDSTNTRSFISSTAGEVEQHDNCFITAL